MSYMGQMPGTSNGPTAAVVQINAVADMTGLDETGVIPVQNTLADEAAGFVLTFSPDYLDVVSPDDPAGDNVAVVRPGTSSVRNVTVERNGSAPTSGGAVEITVTATDVGGVSSAQVFDLYPPETLKSFVESLSPTHLWVFTDNGSGDVEDFGSSPVDAALDGTATIGASARSGWNGELDLSGSGGASCSLNRLGAGGCAHSQDRSWGFVFVSKGTGLARNGCGNTAVLRIRQSSSGAPYILYYQGGASFNADTNYSHTDSGASENLNNTATNICAVVYTYDATAESWTIRWKQTGHRAGHSYRTITGQAPYTTAGTFTWEVLGWLVNDAMHCYGGASFILDSKMSEADFNSLCQVAGI